MNKKQNIFKELKPFGEGASFHHAGLAVASIPPDLDKTFDPIQNVYVAFVSLNGFSLEFVEPADENSPVQQFVKKGQKLYHLCYETDDIDEALKVGRQSGFHCIAKPVPATAFDGRRIAWVFSAVYGLIELVEKEK